MNVFSGLSVSLVFTIACFNHFGECVRHRTIVNLPKCEACEKLVESFLKGIERTEKTNFAGGNTDWEEKKLGSYSTSEVRFLEILENVCKENETTMDQCQTLAEQFEDYLEQWWTEDRWQVPNLRSYLCVTKTKYCTKILTTPDGHVRISPPDPVSKSKSSKQSRPDPTPKTTTPSGIMCPRGFKLLEDNCEDINECLFHPCRKNELCINTHGSFDCRECHPNCAECVGLGPYECKEYINFFQFLVGSWLTLYKLSMVWPSIFFTVILIILCANFVFKLPLLPIAFSFCFVLYFIFKMPHKDELFQNPSKKNM